MYPPRHVIVNADGDYDSPTTRIDRGFRVLVNDSGPSHGRMLLDIVKRPDQHSEGRHEADQWNQDIQGAEERCAAGAISSGF